MSSLDLELDSRMDDLELEWREAREASIIARAEYLALGANLFGQCRRPRSRPRASAARGSDGGADSRKARIARRQHAWFELGRWQPDMVDRELGAEAAGELIERRWFALLSAIRSLQAECEILLEASKLADIAWRRACAQLAQFEMLRDALEEQMSARPPFAAKPTTRLRPEARSGYRGAGKH